MTKHVLLVEARLSGHHPGYMERIAGELLRKGYAVTAVLASADRSHPVVARLIEAWPSFTVHPIDDARLQRTACSRFGIAGRELGLRGLFADAYREVAARQKIDQVLMPYVDYCLHSLALLGSPFAGTPWSGICMRPSFHLAASGVIAPKPSFAWLKERLFIRLLGQKSLRRLFTIDEFLPAYIAARNGPGKPITYLPDPAELRGNHTRESARKVFGISQEKFVVLAYGTLDDRKGLRPLLAAVAAPEMDPNIELLLVGRQSPAIKSFLQSEQVNRLERQGRLWAVDRFVNEEEEQAAFAAADVVWLGYEGHYAMSGVLVLAAQAGKPVVSTRDGLIGWYVREYGLGLAIAIAPEAIGKAITQLRRDDRKLSAVSTGKFRAHTWDGFLSRLLEAVE